MKRETRKGQSIDELSGMRSAGVGGSLAFDLESPGVVAGREHYVPKSTKFKTHSVNAWWL